MKTVNKSRAGRITAWASGVIALLLVGGFSFAQVQTSRARLLTSGSGSAGPNSPAAGWTSNGTTTTTAQNVSFGGLQIQSASPNIIRAAGTPTLNMNDATGGGSIEAVTGLGGGQRFRIVSDVFMVNAPVTYSDFTDDSATTGNRTVNASRGFSAFAATTATITITNSFVAATSQIIATVMTNDATAVLKNCVPAAGSFTCNLNGNTTGITKLAWTVAK